MDTADRLCAVCDSMNILPLRFIVRPDENGADYDTEYSLGLLNGIEQKRYCPLCRLVVRACGERFRDNFQRDAKEITCEIGWQLDGFIYGEEQPRIRALKVYARPWPLSFNEQNRIVPLADNASSGLFFGRRVKERQIDFRLLKKWVRWCQRWHDRGCERLIFESEEALVPPYFKVIDVRRQCVVDTSLGSRYLALSYVWGSAQSLLATKTNILELQKPGSLALLSERICTTIKDAIRLVSKLGERYIWVDSLCILQDDLNTKQAMISSMDLVYGHAFLTVIAATGDSANAGLPGVRRDSRTQLQAIEIVKPGIKLAFVQHLDDSLDKAVYQRRAWTYQERFFSKRCLYFINGQAIFQCRRACWREDIQAEDPDVERNSDMIGKYNFESLANSQMTPLEHYQGCLYEYSRRHLTFNADTLNAFAGILKVLSVRLNSPMINGLPSSIFDWALLWEPSQDLRRRLEFPSWSWAGWIGGVESPTKNPGSDSLEKWMTHHTWIVWEHCELDGSEPLIIQKPADPHRGADTQLLFEPQGISGSLESSCSTQPIKLPPRFLSTPSKSSNVPLNRSSQYPSGHNCPRVKSCPPKNQGPILHFWTVSAKFRISSKTIKHHLPVPGLCLFGIYDANGVLSGRIWLNENLRGSAVDNQFADCEFIALSDTKSTDIPETQYEDLINAHVDGDGDASVPHADVLEDNDLIDAAGPRASGISVIDCGLSSEGWSFYNVLLIQRRDDSAASRMGVGKVHRKAFSHALPPGAQWTEIYLG